jgi:tRNA pseudouridine55 synthase
MSRTKKGQKLDGWINIDKPAGMTSTQVVSRVKWALKPQKIGHAGTLDPLATGILPLALGEATKTIPFAQDRLKTYTFGLLFGESRDTEDAEGQVTGTSDVRPSLDDILAILPRFKGIIMQTPPRYSAIKIDGQRAYDLARDGEDFEIKSREAYIESLDIDKYSKDRADFTCVCGKGTYIRSLGRDIALALGTLGYIVDLRRTAVGPFTTENAISLDLFDNIVDSATLENVLLPLETTLDDIPALALSNEEAAKISGGQFLNFISRPDFERLQQIGIDPSEETHALAVYDGNPVAIVTITGPAIRPVRVINL